MSYLNDLNEAQRAAVECLSGPIMIIAGPGSGKTRVLTYRIAHLITNQCDPFNILALTFTNKAAREMKERIEKIIGPEARNLFIGTFHSVFARILRIDGSKLGYPSNFSIYDTADSKNLIKQIVKEQNLNTDLYKPNIVYNRISSAKNSLLTPQDYLSNLNIMADDAASGRPKIGELYSIYADRCFKAGAMDFDDLLLKMYQLINNFPELLYKYQNKFQQVLVDEFQDTNFAQYEIVRKLSAKHENICVVGDDAQSIYAFRGATIQNILNFERDYPDLKIFKLEQNYRSTSNIVKVANQVIARNKKQLPKKIWTGNDSGDKIWLIKAASDNEEGRLVADSIQEESLRNHFKYNDFAILYRTNAQSRAFEEALRRVNIPYVVYGGLSFYQRKEVKDLLAYLKLIVNPFDEESLRRIINYPRRGIGDTTQQKVSVIASETGLRHWDIYENITLYPFNAATRKKIDDFITMIKSYQTLLQKKNAYEVAEYVAQSTGILKNLYNDKSIEGLSRFENLQELLNSIKEFTEADEATVQNTETADKSLGAYLQQIALLTDQDKNDENADTVKLMTIHAAKGLEFPVIYSVGLEEELFPSKLSLNSREDLEEERRLFYVAITRAEKKLFLSYASSRYKYGNINYCEPSRFIDEISPLDIEMKGGGRPRQPQNFQSQSYGNFAKRFKGASAKAVTYSPSPNFEASHPSELAAGQKVEHQRFGMGTIMNIEGEDQNKIATIEFNDFGTKRLMLRFAKLQIQ